MKFKILLTIVFVEIFLLSLFFSFALTDSLDINRQNRLNKALVEHFMLTDLSIWTEARYTRHPSQADCFAPFQDFPGAIEHFPAGSIVPPSECVGHGAANPL